MYKKIAIYFITLQTLLSTTSLTATPLDLKQELNDHNMKISFEAHAPWNILDGTAEEISGNFSLGNDPGSDCIHAEVSAKDIDYSAGLSVAGRLVAGWLRINPPTPAKFVINKSKLDCSREDLAQLNSCKGTVDGLLTIWGKDYNIDIPVEIKSIDNVASLTGIKEIKWGEYGFGDADSTLAHLKPVVDLNFSIVLPTEKLAANLPLAR